MLVPNYNQIVNEKNWGTKGHGQLILGLFFDISVLIVWFSYHQITFKQSFPSLPNACVLLKNDSYI